MALLPLLLDEIRPHRHHILDDLQDLLGRRVVRSEYVRPWRNSSSRDLGSTINADNNKFELTLDVRHFEPEEIAVKTVDGCVVIEGRHEEREDGDSLVSRQFTRRYALPEWCKDEVVASMSTDGVLSVRAARPAGEARAVPVTRTGPVRRPRPENTNGSVEKEEVKEPQKKKRR